MNLRDHSFMLFYLHSNGQCQKRFTPTLPPHLLDGYQALIRSLIPNIIVTSLALGGWAGKKGVWEGRYKASLRTFKGNTKML